AETTHTLGIVELMSDHLDAAKADFELAYKVFHELTPDGQSTYKALYMLAVVQVQQGDYDGAIASYQEVLAYRMRQFGEQHAQTADALDAIAEAYHGKDDFETATTYKKRGLAIREKLFGPDALDVAISVE